MHIQQYFYFIVVVGLSKTSNIKEQHRMLKTTATSKMQINYIKIMCSLQRAYLNS